MTPNFLHTLYCLLPTSYSSPHLHVSINFRKERSYVFSTSSGNKQAGSSFILQWYSMHSQHLPFFEQGSYVQLHFFRFALILHSILPPSSYSPHAREAISLFRTMRLPRPEPYGSGLAMGIKVMKCCYFLKNNTILNSEFYVFATIRDDVCSRL